VLGSEGQISPEDASSQIRGTDPADIARAVWRKSSWSAANGSCVEVATLRDDLVGVRDTKDREKGPVLVFGQFDWNAFLHGVKHGEFDIT
jgi:hypothetical protein